MGFTIFQLEDRFNYCLQQLRDLGYGEEIDKKKYQFSFINQTGALGLCQRRGKTGDNYIISINKVFVDSMDDNSINSVIMHEAIHTLDDCMCHTGRWKTIAQQVNKVYGYNVKRVTNGGEKFNTYKQAKIKYILCCDNCGHEWKYQRKNKIVALILNKQGVANYRCPYCEVFGKFSVKASQKMNTKT